MVDVKSSRRWFEDAVRCHVECHQGCPWCGRSHCVYRIINGKQHVYSCQTCDFQASYDQLRRIWPVGESAKRPSRKPAFLIG